MAHTVAKIKLTISLRWLRSSEFIKRYDFIVFIAIIHANYLQQLMNITSDNVTVNDATLRILSNLLKQQDVTFDPKDHRSQCVITISLRFMNNTDNTNLPVATHMLLLWRLARSRMHSAMES